MIRGHEDFSSRTIQGYLKLAGKEFHLACNTFWGDDKWSEGESFTFDDSTKKTACGEAWGAARNGSMKCTDVKDKPSGVVWWSPPSNARQFFNYMNLELRMGTKWCSRNQSEFQNGCCASSLAHAIFIIHQFLSYVCLYMKYHRLKYTMISDLQPEDGRLTFRIGNGSRGY